MERDYLIDEKIQILQNNLVILKNELEEVNKYTFMTNLKINGVSLRVINNVGDLFNAYLPIANAKHSLDEFKAVVGKDLTLEHKIDGYTLAQWDADFKVVYDRMTLNKLIDKHETAIKQLKEFYSSEKLENEKFSTLLSSLSDLIG